VRGELLGDLELRDGWLAVEGGKEVRKQKRVNGTVRAARQAAEALTVNQALRFETRSGE
jgi:hypothetical protein